MLHKHNRSLRLEKLGKLIISKERRLNSDIDQLNINKDFLRIAILKNSSGKGHSTNTEKLRKTISFFENRIKDTKISIKIFNDEIIFLEKLNTKDNKRGVKNIRKKKTKK